MTTVSFSTPQARLQQLLPQLFQPETKGGDRYLKFLLTSDQPALIALQEVQEALHIPPQLITPIPNLPPAVLGWMNARNQVLAAIDLPLFLQLTPAGDNRQSYPVIIARLSQTMSHPHQVETEVSLLGLVVNHIQGIERLYPEQIVSPLEEFPDSLTPFLRGCVPEDSRPDSLSGSRLIPVLAMGEIATAPALVRSSTPSPWQIS